MNEKKTDWKDGEKRRLIGIISIEAEEIKRRLEKCKVDGEVITYEELSSLARGSVQDEKRSALCTARRRLILEKQMVFGTIRNVGIKRLSSSEITALGEQSIISVNRAATRKTRELSCAEYDELTKEEQVQYNTRLSVLGVLRHVTGKDQMKKLKKRVENSEETDGRLDLQSTLNGIVAG